MPLNASRKLAYPSGYTMANVPIGVFMSQALPKGVTDPDATNFEIQQLERENRALASLLQSDTKGEYVRKLKERNEQLKRGIPVAPIPQQPVPVEVVNDKGNLVHENEPSKIKVAPANTQSSGSNGAQPPPGQPNPDTSGNPGAKILVEGATDPDSKSPQEKKTLESLGQAPTLDEVHINPPPNPEGEAPREDTSTKISLDTTALMKQHQKQVNNLYSLYQMMAEDEENDLPELSEEEFRDKLGKLAETEPTLFDKNSLGTILQKVTGQKTPSAFIMYVDDPMHLDHKKRIPGKIAIHDYYSWQSYKIIMQALDNLLDIVTNQYHPYYTDIKRQIERRRDERKAEKNNWYKSITTDEFTNEPVFKYYLSDPSDAASMINSMKTIIDKIYGETTLLTKGELVNALAKKVNEFERSSRGKEGAALIQEILGFYDSIRSFLLSKKFGTYFHPEDIEDNNLTDLADYIRFYPMKNRMTGFGIVTPQEDTHIQL